MLARVTAVCLEQTAQSTSKRLPCKHPLPRLETEHTGKCKLPPAARRDPSTSVGCASRPAAVPAPTGFSSRASQPPLGAARLPFPHGGQLHASRLTEQGNGPQGAGKGLGRERPGEQRSAGLPQPRPWPTPSPSPRTSKLGRCRMRSQRGRPGRVRTKGAMPCEYSRLCLFMLRMCSLISFPGAPPRTLK